jgi:hypothetical protein
MRLDARIIWRTLAHVVRRDGIAAEGHATMPEFEGSLDAEPDTGTWKASPPPPRSSSSREALQAPPQP